MDPVTWFWIYNIDVVYVIVICETIILIGFIFGLYFRSRMLHSLEIELHLVFKKVTTVEHKVNLLFNMIKELMNQHAQIIDEGETKEIMLKLVQFDQKFMDILQSERLEYSSSPLKKEPDSNLINDMSFQEFKEKTKNKFKSSSDEILGQTKEQSKSNEDKFGLPIIFNE